MGERLTTSIEQRRSGARVIKFAGVLDEHNGLGDLVASVGTGVTLINLAGVERINSSGTRDWVNWLTSIEASGARPVLVACSPAVVAQLNRVKNFAGNAVVKSFHVPYHCTVCNLDKLLLVNIEDMAADPNKPPTCRCDVCQGPMVLGDNTDNYFAFVGQESEKSKRASAPDIARGSRSKLDSDPAITPPPRAAKAAVLRQSRPSLSMYQLPEEKRASERQIAPRSAPADERRHVLIIVVGVLLLVIAILVALLVV